VNRIAVLLLAFAFAFAAAAQPAGDATPLQFADAAEEARFHALAAELRCVMCQNQSLADSNAQIAHDMRREVLALMRKGNSDAQVKQFLVDRYGEFVLYRPAVQRHTWLLWFGPGVVLLGGAGLVAWIVRRRAAAMPAARGGKDAADQEEQEW
jgi:cytochrome c-type biogenesis protein CcmH